MACIIVCDITGERDAKTFGFETEETQTDPASGRTEYTSDSIDLSHEGAMRALSLVHRRLCQGGVVTKQDFTDMLRGMKKSASTRR